MTKAPLGGHKPRRFLIPMFVVGLVAVLSGLTTGPGAAAAPALDLTGRAAAAAPAPADPIANGWLFYKYPTAQSVACAGLGFNNTEPFYSRDDCGFMVFTLSEHIAEDKVKVELYGPDGAKFATLPATDREEGTYDYDADLKPAADWPAGRIRALVVADGKPAGEITFGHNQLGADIDAVAGTVKPGDPITVTGDVYKLDTAPPTGAATKTAAGGATFSLELLDADGDSLHTQNVTAANDGTFSATIPGSATTGVTAGPETQFLVTLAMTATNAAYTEAATGAWAAERAGAGSVTLEDSPTELILENSFVSAVGWVKPGDSYPSRVFVRNLTEGAFNNVVVTLAAAPSSVFTDTNKGEISNDGASLTWNVGTVAADSVETLVLESQAADDATDSADIEADPQVVWKDLSSRATLTVGGSVEGVQRSHGPRVIPPSSIFDTARYGDRPFPVVPVDYRDRAHQDSNSGDELANVINSPTLEGSTFNLFQEMSLGQLFPNGTVPSAGIATADFGDHEYDFTLPEPSGTCHGATLPTQAAGTPVYAERIKDGFYQLPGDTDYYGDDKTGSALVGAETGQGVLFDIDSACGPTGKLVYDAATIADPEIDYSDFDTDKDGVVDFFMVVFAGCGGNGSSQLQCPYDDVPYDNVWPHSSSLESYYTDPDTKLTGYISNDQLKNLEGKPLWYTNTTYSDMTTEDQGDELKVFVRVGPYNVNPETAIDQASVISHEYGHSLGLPDFYTLGSNRATYGDWNLMATDKSQHMDVFSRQEMGWIVPEVLEPGSSRTVENWTDSKEDTHTIKWETANGNPYTLSGPHVHNALSFVAKLPGRQLIDPAKFDTGDKASATHAWWSGSGNDFGCPPASGKGGHNLDVVIPGIGDLPAGTELTLDFKSLWDIEWDYDYGFVLTTVNGGETYLSSESTKGYTTPAAMNRYANGCQRLYGNGITGSSGSYKDGTEQVDRLNDEYKPSVFLADQYDISELAGVDNGVLRFSYATDPGTARPGWYIDDIKVTATLPDGSTEVLLETDLEDADEGGPESPYFFNGGCKDDTKTAPRCTGGFNYVASDADAPNDHAYYMELRDRSGFDLDSNGQSDRGEVDWEPGLSLVYTDEAHGYGNSGTDDPPAQSPLDSQPVAGDDLPNLADAAWTAGDTPFSDMGAGWVDNYTNPAETQPAGAVVHPWRFAYNCLSFDVLSMSGNGEGPATPDGDLTGDVKFTMGNGCADYDYGYEDGEDPEPPGNAAPTALGKVTPKVADKRRTFTFDARSSTDAETPANLDYSWNFGDGGVTKDAVGPLVQNKFTTPGVYKVTLTVTDPRGASDTKDLLVMVTQTVQCAQTPVDRVGGWRHRHNHDAQKHHYCINDKDAKTKGDRLRMSFEGPRLHVHHGRASNGGSAVVIIDGVLQKGAVNFYGKNKQPRFGFKREYRGLGKGWHTVQLVMRAPQGNKRFAYMDSFTIAGKARTPN